MHVPIYTCASHMCMRAHTQACIHQKPTQERGERERDGKVRYLLKVVMQLAGGDDSKSYKLAGSKLLGVIDLTAK